MVELSGPDHATWPLGEAFSSGEAIPVDDVAARFGNFSAGPFPEPVASAVLLPILPPGAKRPVAVVVAGISSRLRSDEMHRGFHDLLSRSITTSVANARAYDEERKRAEALAEIDRAKTAFFSNVSHEFRTPLTLMLGPTEQLLALPPGALPTNARTQLDVVHRNALRLQKLVNSLLDFSRLEAGRIQASYEPTDLAELTSDLASVFRSAIEKAGLKYTVNCPPLREPMHVDRDMWEKIVLNLISNAFKFTLAGEIEVSLKLVEKNRSAIGASKGTSHKTSKNPLTNSFVTLCVRDTGTGIVAEELPRVFERFHCVEGAVSRTHEGTGIGLALVQELVKLHGGTVSLESVFGKGSSFTVALPTGTAHLPQDRLGRHRILEATATSASSFLEEAARWVPQNGNVDHPARIVHATPDESTKGQAQSTTVDATRQPARILVADDNADMRDYVRRLLAEQFHVETAADGKAALELIHEHRPDLVITDVMMPCLDGFGLVQRLRADAHTSALPIILLSARAGEEARVEGLKAGADDYLIKPFSARELLARVESQLKLTALRLEAGEQMRMINTQLEQRVEELQDARQVAMESEEALRDAQAQVQAALAAGSVGTWNWDLPSNLLSSNPALLRIFGLNLVDHGGGLPAESYVARIIAEDQPVVEAAMARALAEKSNGAYEVEYRVRDAEENVRWVSARGQVEYDATGKPLRLPGALTDITERKRADETGLASKKWTPI